MSFNNSVRDWRGNIEGFRCFECGGIFQSMWGEVCNGCRQKERRHKEILKAIALRGASVEQQKPNDG